MKALLTGIISLLFSVNSYSSILCTSYCISSQSDYALYLEQNIPLSNSQVFDLGARAIGSQYDSFSALERQCEKKIKKEDGVNAKAILVILSPVNSQLLTKTMVDDRCQDY